MRAKAIVVVLNLNLLFVRYVVLDLNDQLIDGVIFQWPWDSLEKALLVRKLFRMS